MVPLFYVFVAIFAILLTYMIQKRQKNKRFWKLLDEFYGESTLPLVGNAHQFGSTSETLLIARRKMFKNSGGKTFKFLIGGKAFVNLCEPQTVEVLLSSNKEITKIDDYTFLLGEWLGDGLLLSSGAKWRQRRKILTPSFHFRILEQFVKVFNDNGKILVKQLAQEKEKAFDIFPYINRYALDVISETAMGVSLNAQTTTDSKYVKAVHSICKMTNTRFLSPWKRVPWMYVFSKDYYIYKDNLKTLHGMTNNVIKTRREMLKDQIEKVRNDKQLTDNNDQFTGTRKKIAFLDMLLLSKLPDGSFLSDKDVREETDTFMFEGHDTTTSAMSFALYALANHPDIQQKAFEEVISIVGDDPNANISYEQLQDMKYLDMVVKETLRIYPSVPGYGRILDNDLELPDGKLIPAGCCVIVDAFLLGRHPNTFTDPEKFYPERFTIENTSRKSPYMSVPFSAGSRNCIGQKFAMLEVKSVLSKMLMNYELSTAGDLLNARLASDFILKSVNGVNVVIKNRILKN